MGRCHTEFTAGAASRRSRQGSICIEIGVSHSAGSHRPNIVPVPPPGRDVPPPLTGHNEYDRNPSIVFDGIDYRHSDAKATTRAPFVVGATTRTATRIPYVAW